MVYWKIGRPETAEEIVRVDGKWVQTPIVTLDSVSTNRNIVLMGTLHIASISYFSTLRSYFDRYESDGYKILYEDLSLFPLSLAGSDKTLIKTVGETIEKLDRQLKQFGLGYQLSQIKPRRNWVPADLIPADLVRFPDVATKICGSIEKFKENCEENSKLTFLEQYAKALSAEPYQLPNVVESRVLVDERNKFAVDAILRHATDRNVLTYWGAAHIHGIKKLLLKNGFVEYTEPRWLCAFDWKRFVWQ